MTTAAVSMVKDERDIVEQTVRRMASQVDFLIVADNGSTDGTRQVLEQLASELALTVLDDPEVGYFQAVKMSRLASLAAREGADWVVPFDADEIWLSRHGRIADVLAERPEAIAEAKLFDHVPTAQDPVGDPIARIGWHRRTPAPLAKVACRAAVQVRIHQGNHGAGYDVATVPGLLEVRHFPYRSVEQMIRKARNGAAAYAATDLPEDVGAHWRMYGRLTDEQIGDVFRAHFWSPDPSRDRTLVFDPVPLKA